ncbi:hypothetical protein B0H14DRAFT_1219822 [Mycena olivaceomarginata]|nr:hypothetical protein B0H14DRAFT_1219822 [Mycena olivaceomarginata]
MPRRASSPGPGPSSLSRASSPSTAPNSEPISLGDADDTLSRAWHSWIHRSPPRSTTPSRFDVELERTRLKVTKALGSIIQVAGDQVLPIAAEALSVAPIPALAPAVKILDSIWKSVNAVQTNRTACLRLTDRCASLLLAIQDKVARSGDAVARELEAHLKTLEQSFSDIDDFFKEQVELPFIYRYIKRDEIHESITRHNQSVNDCIMLFSLGVNLSHMAASLQMQQSMHAHQLELVTPAQVSMLLAQDETNPPSPISEADPEAPHLTNFPPAGTPHTLHGDIPSPSGKTYEIQQIEDDSDSASDADDLRRVLRSALDAPDNRTVTRILQIPNADMSVPAMTKALLQELEREQQQPVPPAGSSPSPRTRTLTWPVDGIPARQVALLNRQFVEGRVGGP